MSDIFFLHTLPLISFLIKALIMRRGSKDNRDSDILKALSSPVRLAIYLILHRRFKKAICNNRIYTNLYKSKQKPLRYFGMSLEEIEMEIKHACPGHEIGNRMLRKHIAYLGQKGLISQIKLATSSRIEMASKIRSRVIYFVVSCYWKLRGFYG